MSKRNYPEACYPKQMIHLLVSKMKEKLEKVVAATLFQTLEILLPPPRNDLFISVSERGMAVVAAGKKNTGGMSGK